jgi:hypothetical protein
LYLKKQRGFSQIILALASLFKFYPLPTLAVALWVRGTGRIRKVVSAILLISTSAWVIFDLRQISRGFSFPNPTGTAFGSPIFGLVLNKYFHSNLSENQELFIGFCILVFGVSIVQVSQRFSNLFIAIKSQLLNLPKEMRTVYKIYATTYVFTFFSGMSYVYRLIFVLPVLYVILTQTRSNKILLALGVSSIWFSYEVFRFEIVGDMLLFLIAVLIVWIEIPAELFKIREKKKLL